MKTKEFESMSQNIMKKAVLCGGAVAEGLIADIVRYSGKSNPSVMIMAAPADDSMEVFEALGDMFRPYTSKIEYLKLMTPELSVRQMREHILQCDILWVSGGYTEKLMERWDFFYLNETILQAAARGTVMCGSSAGGICWSYAGFNDFSDGRYDWEQGINLVPVFFGPHYAGGNWLGFDERLNEETDECLPAEGWALTNDAALFCSGEKFEVRYYSPEAKAVRFFRKNGKWDRTEMIRCTSDENAVSERK